MRVFKARFRDSKVVAHIISDGRANVFSTQSPEEEIAMLANEYRKMGIYVVAYKTSSRAFDILPNYLDMFISLVGGTYAKIL